MADKKAQDIMKLDLYGILDVPPNATEKEILKAYRKRALKCHPDKNPDNPKAAEEFHELSRALEVLTDAAAKEAYDKVLRAKKAAEIRNRELDAKRKKLKDDLESRESSAFAKKETEANAAAVLQKEMERLRKEGSRLLKEEQKKVEEELKEQRAQARSEEAEEVKTPPRLKVKWTAKKDDPDNGGYSKANLIEIFSNYGTVAALIVSSKKAGSAIVEFESPNAALRAVRLESGHDSNPMKLSWLSGQPTVEQAAPRHVFCPPSQQSATQTAKPLFASFSSTTSHTTAPSVPASEDRDFESLVLMRMRQAQERKRLMEEMQREEEQQGEQLGDKRKEPS